MNIIAITQARTNSTRLPQKVLKKVDGKSLLQIHLQRICQSKLISKLIVATTTSTDDQPICEIAESLKMSYYCGSEDDVLDRYYQAALKFNPDYVVRLTSDCPLIDSQLIDHVINHILMNKTDYCSNILEDTYPDGQDIEVFTFNALKKAWKESKLKSDREHVTPYIIRNTDYKKGKLFKAVNCSSPVNYGHLRMTVDEHEDFEVIKSLISHLGINKTWLEYANFLVNHKDLTSKNEHIIRNEGYLKSLEKDNGKI